MNKLPFLLCLYFSCISLAQQPATSSTAVLQGLQEKEQLTQNSRVKNLPFRNVGPTVMSGRVVDFAVNPSNPTEFYVGYASGGVWHTVNNGTTFTPILDSSPTQNVGSLAVDWTTKTVWVGTGEVNASRSSYAGVGVLQSKNNGKTWVNMGLEDSHHISKIVINPENSNEVIVGAVGHLYSNNAERGVFKTVDGGKTWSKTLFINDHTGIIELDVNPSNFNVMYASAWDKDRKAYNFRGSGDGSGIYKSIDAGTTWSKVSVAGSGFPIGDGVGRIGLAVVNDEMVYAVHDNQGRRKATESKKNSGELSKDDFKAMSAAQFLALDNKKLNVYLRQNGFQEKYRAENVKQMIRSGSAQPIDLAKYLEDANSMLFDTPVIGAEVYKSTNGGKTWKKTHEDYLDGVYYSYGYYFGKIHVDPSNADGIYIYGVPILKSKDGGSTFSSIGADNVHADHHALWINPKMPGHLINGNDGGVNISYDDGANWIKCNTPAVGQFYAINVDNETPYNVYGGLQDNGVWVGAHTTNENVRWHQSGQYPYKSIMGGDGMQVEIDNRNSDIVYTGFQFGNYFRIDRAADTQTYIQPKHELGESPYRYNWQTPIELSDHNQDILYLGGNKLMRSMNQGEDWEAISFDLTHGGKPGNVAYGTLTSISESRYQFGLIYTGSDDGLVYVTRNGGGDWKKISNSFPKDLWVSRVIASRHKKARAFVTLNGYRWDDFTPYVYVTEDFGTTWKDISSNLPMGAVNVIKEDPNNMNVLYLGTDNGAYVSLDRGDSWEPFKEGLPNVAFHDIVIQETAKHLVLGTHGRSIYIGDISLVQQISEENRNNLIVGAIAPKRVSRRWGTTGFNNFGNPMEPKLDMAFYSPSNGKARMEITSEDGQTLQEFNVDAVKGINVAAYDLKLSKKGIKALEKKGQSVKQSDNGVYYLGKGIYHVTISVNGISSKSSFELN